MPSRPEPCDVFTSFKVDDNLFVMMAEKEKLNGGVPNGYSPDKSGLASSGIFSLSLFPMLQNRALGLIKYSKKYLPSDVLNKMYRGIVEPHLSYCCSVWGCCSESKLDVLQKI